MRQRRTHLQNCTNIVRSIQAPIMYEGGNLLGFEHLISSGYIVSGQPTIMSILPKIIAVEEISSDLYCALVHAISHQHSQRYPAHTSCRGQSLQICTVGLRKTYLRNCTTSITRGLMRTQWGQYSYFSTIRQCMTHLKNFSNIVGGILHSHYAWIFRALVQDIFQ